MIETVVEPWHRLVAAERPGALDGLLADDVVFYSPVVYTPQRGKTVTKMYLRAAAEVLAGDPVHGPFHYTKQVVAGDVASSSSTRPSSASTSMASTSCAAMTPDTSWSSA
jgi:ketosteroid isomerase-like protein